LKESGYMDEATTFDLWLSGKAGLADDTVAEIYGLQPSTVERSPDVRAGRRERKALRHERVIDFHEEGLSPAAIAAQMKMPLRTVQRTIASGRLPNGFLAGDEIGAAHMITLYGASDAEELREWFDAWIGRELERLVAAKAEAEAEIERQTAELGRLTAQKAEQVAENERLTAERERLTAYAAELEAHSLLRVNGRN